MEAVMNHSALEVDLHRAADVLYLAVGRPRDDVGEDRADGIVLRFDAETDEPSGVTVIGYQAFGWPERIDELARIIGDHIGVSRRAVIAAIKSAQ